MSKSRKFIVLLLVFLFMYSPLNSVFTSVCYASDGVNNSDRYINKSGWIEHTGDIYDDPGSSDSATGAMLEEEDSDPGLGEEILGGLVWGIASALNGLEEMAHISISDVIYGRVCGFGDTSADGNRVSWFSFELIEDNPYGYIAALLYSSFRGISIIIIVCIFCTMIARATVSPSGKAKEIAKSGTTNYMIVIFMLFLMPNLLDLATYVRDHLLYAIASLSLENFGKMNLYEAFSRVYDSNNTFMNAALCLGVTILALYLAFVYISVAMGMTILFIMFPFICVESSFDKQALGRWVKEAMGYLLIPCLDAALLMIPLVMGALGGAGFLQLIVCSMIVPARQVIRNLLGLGSSSGLDRAGLLGAMGAMQIARSAARTTSKVAGMWSQRGSDKASARREQALANGEKEELLDAEDQMYGRNGYNGSKVTRLPLDLSKKDAKKASKALDGYYGHLDKADELKSKLGDMEREGLTGTEDYENMKSDYGKELGMASSLENGKLKGILNKSPAGSSDFDHLAGASRLSAAQGIGLNDVDSSITGNHELDISNLTAKNGQLEIKKRELAEQNAQTESTFANGGIDKKDRDILISRNKKKMAECDTQIAKNKDKITAIKENKADVESNAKGYGANLGSIANGKGASTIARSGGYSGGAESSMSADRLNKIEMRFANAKNFDSGAFSSLSHQQKAAFYKKRATKQLVKAVSATTVGGIGAAVGMSAATFFGPTTKAVFTVGGANLGGAMGVGVAGAVNAVATLKGRNVVEKPAKITYQDSYVDRSSTTPNAQSVTVNRQIEMTPAAGGSYSKNQIINVTEKVPVMRSDVQMVATPSVKLTRTIHNCAINQIASLGSYSTQPTVTELKGNILSALEREQNIPKDVSSGIIDKILESRKLELDNICRKEG